MYICIAIIGKVQEINDNLLQKDISSAKINNNAECFKNVMLRMYVYMYLQKCATTRKGTNVWKQLQKFLQLSDMILMTRN